MWADHLRNSRAVYGMFGNDIPELRDLSLEQIVFNYAVELGLALNLGQVPKTLPERWQRKQYDRLQLRVRCLGPREVASRYQEDQFRVPPATRIVSVDLGKHNLQAVSTDGSFQLTATFHEVMVEFFPFRAAEYEFSPAWYHR